VLTFIARAEVVHLLGPPGTCKTHLASALAIEAVKAGRSVYFSNLADIVASLAKAERDGGNLFFKLVNGRYEKGAMILTSNRGFAEWGEIFLLDRLLHHAVSSKSKGRATGFVSTAISWNTFAPKSLPSHRRPRSAARAQQKRAPMIIKTADHPVPNPSTRENWTPTIGETSVPVDTAY